MPQIIKHRRGSLESLNGIKSGIEKGELVIASSSTNLTTTNGTSILFAASANGTLEATNRFLMGSTPPAVFSNATYNGLVKGVPYYSSDSASIYLLGQDGNTQINLVGNIVPFSQSVSSKLIDLQTQINNVDAGGQANAITLLNDFTGSTNIRLNNLESKSGSVDISISNLNSFTSSQLTINSGYNLFTSSQQAKDNTLATYTGSNDAKWNTLATYTGSNDTKWSTLATYTGSVDNKFNAVGVSTSSLNAFTSSQEAKDSTLATYTGSVSNSITRINTATSSLNLFTSSQESKNTTLATYTGSNDGKWSALATYTGSVNNQLAGLSNKTGSYAITGSNLFYGNQTISGSLYITQDFVVQGSSSIQNISSSTLNIGTNLITVAVNQPAVRFGGLAVIDSGSSGGSGSLLYDALQDEFIFVHRGNGTNVTSSHFVLGPETYDSLGNETYLTNNRLPKGTGKEHIVDSQITDNGTTVTIPATASIGFIADLGTPLSVSQSIAAISQSIGGGSISTSITNLNLFTSSQESKNTTLATYTGSNDTKWSTLATYTGSVNNSITLINTVTASVNTFTQSQESKNSTLATYTGSNDTKWSTLTNVTSSILSFTSSQEAKDSTLATYTGSNDTKWSTLATYTGSVSNSITRINTATSSLNLFTSSQESKNTTLATYTGSNDAKWTTLTNVTSSILLFTSSQESKNITLATYTASLDNKFIAIGASTSSINLFTSSQESKNTTLATYTGSVNNRLSNLENTSASVNVGITQLNNYTSSLKQAISVNGSDATVLGNLTVTSDLVVQGNTVTLNTTELVVEDKLISLASGSTNAAAANGAGIQVLGASATFTYDSTPDAWTFNKPLSGSAVTASINIPGGASTKRVAFRGTTDNIEFVPAADTAGDLLQWDGTNFIMDNTIDGGQY